MYLLSTQCLLDRVTGHVSASSIDALPAREIHVSTISLAQALAAIEQTEPPERDAHREALRGYLGMVRSFANLVAFEEQAAMRWCALKPRAFRMTTPSGKEVWMSDATLMVVATAIALNLTLVEPAQAYHGEVAGFQVLNP